MDDLFEAKKKLVKSMSAGEYKAHLRTVAKKQRGKKFGRFKTKKGYTDWYKGFTKKQRRVKRWGFGALAKSQRKKMGKLGIKALKGKYKTKSRAGVYNSFASKNRVGPKRNAVAAIKKQFSKKKK